MLGVTEILLVLSTGIISLLSFYMGAILGRGGQIADKEIKLPNPMKAYKEHKEKLEVKKEQERLDIVMQNIDNYDGTSNNQKDIPQ